MNYIQLGLFFIFAVACLCLGTALFVFIHPKDRLMSQRLILLGESLLLGAGLIVGELVLLSLIGLYRQPFLWTVVLLNLIVLTHKEVRTLLKNIFVLPRRLDIFVFLFLLLFAVFILRNIYFLVDVDSHSAYLFAQKLWLEHSSSIFANPGINIDAFVPHFDCVPYSLGLSLFPQELYFPQLINLFWRLIVLVLVFGYTRYRLNSAYALAASMFLIFNDHFFISGANQWVLLNGALIAFIFAIAYNLWEAREENSPFRFFLSLVFLSQLMANKYQMAYVLIALLTVGAFIQKDVSKMLKAILSKKEWLIVLGIFALSTSFWYLKNYLATGWPFFPVLAGKLGLLGLTPEKDAAFLQVFRGLTPTEIIKYLNFLFIWPGIVPAKYVCLTISFFPLIMVLSILKDKFDKEVLKELFYWLSLSAILVVTTCLASHQDPRYFRFALGVFSFAALLSIKYVLQNCLNIKNQSLIAFICIVLAVPGYSIVKISGGASVRPSLKDNLGVLFDKIHFKDVMDRHYPANIIAQEGFEQNKEKALRSAWYFDLYDATRFSAFLLPTRPEVSFWLTNIVSWSSYEREEDIVKDIKNYGIEYLMDVRDGRLVFLTPQEFAKEAVKNDRRPKKIFYPYDFPPELTKTHFK